MVRLTLIPFIALSKNFQALSQGVASAWLIKVFNIRFEENYRVRVANGPSLTAGLIDSLVNHFERLCITLFVTEVQSCVLKHVRRSVSKIQFLVKLPALLILWKSLCEYSVIVSMPAK